MKVIDLLNRIANGKRPEKIKYKNKIYNWSITTGNYILEDDRNVSINWDFVSMFDLRNEVEIIEEEPRNIEVCGSLFTRSEYNRLAGIEEDKKIEKIETYDIAGNIFIDDDSFKYIPIDKDKLTANEQVFVDKINEIIDKIISMEVR